MWMTTIATSRGNGVTSARTALAATVAALAAGFGTTLAGVAFCLLLRSSVAWSQESRPERQLQLLRQRYSTRQAQFASEMETLAKRCAELSFLSDADRIRARAKLPAAGAYDLDDLPANLLPDVPLDLPPQQREWQVKLRQLETDFAADLYRLSRDALTQGHPSLAFDWVREVAFHDPNHKQARGMLGFVTKGQAWTTPFARRQEQRGMVDHPRFGWIEAKHVDRYLAGERFVAGRWMSAEKEAALRSDFQNGWVAETEHFAVKTNVSLERGVEVARALERFHDFFLREYTAFFHTPQQMQRLFDNPATVRDAPRDPYNVYYFKSKAEFTEYLQKRQPNISAANGLYMPQDRIAYFYDEPAPEARAALMGTVYHEVTHQLLGESLPKTVDVGVNSDFWVIEGFPCYLESFAPNNPNRIVGNPEDTRLRWAKEYVVQEAQYIPLHQFTAYGQQKFPKDHLHYSQAAGLAHFFLHYEDGVYRDKFVEYLTQIYSPVSRIRDKPKNLAELTGVPLETLDQQYRGYITALPAPRPIGVR